MSSARYCVCKIDSHFFLVSHVIVAHTYAVIVLVNVYRTHGTNFDSGFGFYVLDRFIAFSLS